MLAAYARIPARFSVPIRRLRSKPLSRWEFGRPLSCPRGFIDFDSFPGPVSTCQHTWDDVPNDSPARAGLRRPPEKVDLVADFHENDHRFHLKSINDFSLGDHHRSEATLACLILL